MRAVGWILLVCATLMIGRVVLGKTEGDWRSIVLWLGLGMPLLLFGLALNGWAVRLCAAMAWTLPATALFGGLVIIVDPGYASVLDGPRDWIGSAGEARLFGGFLVIVGTAGLGGWGWSVRNGLDKW
jgi:hypothetical protein